MRKTSRALVSLVSALTFTIAGLAGPASALGSEKAAQNAYAYPTSESVYRIVLPDCPQADQVLVPTWTEINGQDDLVWYAASKRNDGTWVAEIDTSRHGGGPMISHIYADGKIAGALGYVAPVSTGALVMQQADYNYLMLISNLPDASSVQVPTWSDDQGQEDIMWYNAEYQGNGIWSAKIDTFRHGGGAMTSHVYADGECILGATYAAPDVPTAEISFSNGCGTIAPGFVSEEISDQVFSRILGGSYPADCTVPLSDLRYLTIRHVGFDGYGRAGELIVNKKIAKDVLEIFSELYQRAYLIERVELIDEYGADDETSMTANNSSAFCYRTIRNSKTLSNHALGLAIDINPLYNPYVRGDYVEPSVGAPYADRTKNTPYKLDKNDLCVRLFTEHGFTWGGAWNGATKDYQHFDMRG